MAGPGLPVNIDTTYVDDAADSSVKIHQGHHDTIHGIVNLLDTVTGSPVATLTNSQSGTTYTLVLADAGKIVECTSASAVTLTVPPNSSVAFPVGTVILVRQYGAGQVTLTPGAGVTLRSRGAALRTVDRYSEASVTKRATDEWVISGDITT